MIGEMSGQTKDLMNRMSDVIWSMKPVEEDKNLFTSRVKNYCSELLTPKGIVCEYDIDESAVNRITNPVIRKNILLIVKEAMNNIAKYSGADNASVSLLRKDTNIVLQVTDNGMGFSTPEHATGNGLGNMQQRSKDSGGECKIVSSPGIGVSITCTFPANMARHYG